MKVHVTLIGRKFFIDEIHVRYKVDTKRHHYTTKLLGEQSFLTRDASVGYKVVQVYIITVI